VSEADLLVGLLLAAAVVVTIAVLREVGQRRLRPRDDAWLPAELRGAALVYSEREFIANRPVRIGAWVDRAYALPSGTLVLVEFKRRERPVAFLGDVVQLSAQKLAIERAGAGQVAPHGYVAVVHPWSGRITPLRVRLEDEGAVVARYHRATKVLSGVSTPTKTHDQVLCLDCAFQPECRPGLGQAGTSVSRGSDSTVSEAETGRARSRGPRSLKSGRSPSRRLTTRSGAGGQSRTS